MTKDASSKMNNEWNDGLPKDISEEQSTYDVMESLQLLAQQRLSSGLDLSMFDKEQLDKLLDHMTVHEAKHYDFQTKRLDAIKRLELERIRATVLHKRTWRYIALGASLVVLPAVTVLILFYREQFFVPWLTFLTGVLGGVGLSKLGATPTNNEKNTQTLLELTKEENNGF